MTPPCILFSRKYVDMAVRPQLHLVSTQGANVSPAIREAVENAYRWVAKDYPHTDEAQLANWAEAVALTMQSRGSDIRSLTKYAYAALGGKVRDWNRTGTAQEQSAGVARDLERIGGSTSSFQGLADRKILFGQLENALEERDRDILVLLLTEHDAQEIAEELKTSYPAARKAIQRLRERCAFLVGVAPSNRNGGPKRTDVVAKGLRS